jgi:hypothetical protein
MSAAKAVGQYSRFLSAAGKTAPLIVVGAGGSDRRQNLEIAPVSETHERVMRQAAGMNPAVARTNSRERLESARAALEIRTGPYDMIEIGLH